MGTSNSFKGPGGRPPLLPPWATPGTPPPAAPEPPPEPGDGGDADPQDAGGDDQPPESDPSASRPAPAPPSVGHWASAKRSLGKATSSGGGGRGDRLARAGRGYVRALGGTGRAAASSSAGRASTRALGGFLSDVANNGYAAAMASRGLDRLVGAPPEQAVAALTDVLAPAGANREEAAARAAVNEALIEFYNDPALTAAADAAAAMQNITVAAFGKAIVTAVSAYIYKRWLGDLGIKIEQQAVSRHAAVRLEKEVKKFVRDAVRFDLAGRDAVRMNWSREGRALIDRVYADAFALLGGGES